MITENGWHRPFDDPIPLPGGGKLLTLRDAANYITSVLIELTSEGAP